MNHKMCEPVTLDKGLPILRKDKFLGKSELNADILAPDAGYEHCQMHIQDHD